MEKSSSISSSKLPRGFLVFSLLLLLFECGMAGIPEYVLFEKPYEEAALRMKGAVADGDNGFDIIVLGDCTGWAAIRPLVLEKELGRTAFNFSVNSAQTYLMSYVLLKRYLQNCMKMPELVVLQVSAAGLQYPYGMNLDALKYFILPWLRVDTDFTGELSPELRRACFKWQLLRSVPSLRNQFFLRKRLFSAGTLISSNSADYEAHLAYYAAEKGFYNEDLDPRKGKKRPGRITDRGDPFATRTFSRYNLHYIDRILTLLLQHRLPVAVCITPVMNDEMELWNRYRVRDRFNQALAERLAGYDNVAAVWDLADAVPDPEEFADRLHVGSAGASRYSRALAHKVKQLDMFVEDRGSPASER